MTCIYSNTWDFARQAKILQYEKYLNLLKSYLTERKQFVSFRGYQMLNEILMLGVSQGQVLEPLAIFKILMIYRVIV